MFGCEQRSAQRASREHLPDEGDRQPLLVDIGWEADVRAVGFERLKWPISDWRLQSDLEGKAIVPFANTGALIWAPGE
jgi:hypothetical protein